MTIRYKIDSSNNRLDYIIIAEALRDILRKLELLAINLGTFPLHYLNLSVNNIYIDNNFNIIYLID